MSEKKITSTKELKKYMKEHRSENMLTVKDLIKYLKTCNPDACILAFEPNSNAYIEQWKKLPNQSIRTVAEDKIKEKEYLEQWYRGTDPKEAAKKIKKQMKDIYRYSNDDDVIIRF